MPDHRAPGVAAILTNRVFVAGGTPDVTYNPRSGRHLEAEVQNYLSQSGKALSIFGPTKCGKTVLVQRLLPHDGAIWIQGSDITSPEDIWRRVVDFLGLWDTVELATGATSDRTGSMRVGIDAGVKVELGGGKASAITETRTYSRTRALADVAREALEVVKTPIVIDDFHFVESAARKSIAHAIKTIIPYCHVIMIAVPYDAFEAVTAEPDLGGRVFHLELEPWSEQELEYIAAAGFEALNLTDGDSEVAKACAKESFGAPFLMQQLCFEVCSAAGILETVAIRQRVLLPDSWTAFLQRIARRTRPPIFQKLLDGAKTRGQDRLLRQFKDGGPQLDIYGCVLRGLERLGPQRMTRYSDVRKFLDETNVTPAPNGQQVGNALAQMNDIAARTRGHGDPAFVYKNERAYLVDPFLMFYLSRGEWAQDS